MFGVIRQTLFLSGYSKDSVGIGKCLRNERIISTVGFLFLLSTSETRLRPPRILVRSDGLEKRKSRSDWTASRWKTPSKTHPTTSPFSTPKIQKNKRIRLQKLPYGLRGRETPSWFRAGEEPNSRDRCENYWCESTCTGADAISLHFQPIEQISQRHLN